MALNSPAGTTQAIRLQSPIRIYRAIAPGATLRSIATQAKTSNSAVVARLRRLPASRGSIRLVEPKE